MRHKCFESATLIHGDPLFYSFVIVLYDRTIGQSERRTGDSFVVSSSGWIRIEILNDRCYDTEAELGYFGSSFDIFLLQKEQNGQKTVCR